MARPIKETPRLNGKASYDFQQDLKENDSKKANFSFRKISKETEKRIVKNGPKW